MKTFRRLREEAFLTQRELAAACGVSKQSVWEWEHGYARPSPENLRKLTAILRKDVSELLDALDATAKEAKEQPAAWRLTRQAGKDPTRKALERNLRAGTPSIAYRARKWQVRKEPCLCSGTHPLRNHAI